MDLAPKSSGDARDMLYRAQIYLLKQQPKARDPLPTGRRAKEIRWAIRILAALEELIQLCE